jgi:hypothetical protein
MVELGAWSNQAIWAFTGEMQPAMPSACAMTSADIPCSRPMAAVAPKTVLL